MTYELSVMIIFFWIIHYKISTELGYAAILVSYDTIYLVHHVVDAE